MIHNFGSSVKLFLFFFFLFNILASIKFLFHFKACPISHAILD